MAAATTVDNSILDSLVLLINLNFYRALIAYGVVRDFGDPGPTLPAVDPAHQ
jgi:hypothetical protein